MPKQFTISLLLLLMLLKLFNVFRLPNSGNFFGRMPKRPKTFPLESILLLLFLSICWFLVLPSFPIITFYCCRHFVKNGRKHFPQKKLTKFKEGLGHWSESVRPKSQLKHSDAKQRSWCTSMDTCASAYLPKLTGPKPHLNKLVN